VTNSNVSGKPGLVQAVFCDHCRMFLQGIEDRRRMAHGGNNGPDQKRQAKKCRKRILS